MARGNGDGLKPALREIGMTEDAVKPAGFFHYKTDHQEGSWEIWIKELDFAMGGGDSEEEAQEQLLQSVRDRITLWNNSPDLHESTDQEVMREAALISLCKQADEKGKLALMLLGQFNKKAE